MKNKKWIILLTAGVMVLGTACSKTTKEPAPIPVESPQESEEEQSGEAEQGSVSADASVSGQAAEEGAAGNVSADSAEEKQ